MTQKKAAASAEKRAKAAKKKTPKIRVVLKPRQAKLLEGLVEGKSVRAAALEAGYSANTAAHPEDLLDTVAMRKALNHLLAPPEKIAARINEGLDAMETRFFQFQGEVTEARNVIAWGERRAYAELAARLKGLTPGLPFDPNTDGPSNITVNYINVAALAEP